MGVRAQITASWNTRQGDGSVRLEHSSTFLEVSIFTHVKHPLLFSIFFVSNRRSFRWLSEGCSVLARGFMDLLRRRTSENTGSWKKTAATFAFPLPPHPRPSLPCSLLFSLGTAPVWVCAPEWSKTLPVPFCSAELERSSSSGIKVVTISQTPRTGATYGIMC